MKSCEPVKLNKVKVVDALIKTSTRFESLRKYTPQLGPSKEATHSAEPKAKRIPPIVAKIKKVKTSFINAVSAQTSGLVSFAYT